MRRTRKCEVEIKLRQDFDNLNKVLTKNGVTVNKLKSSTQQIRKKDSQWSFLYIGASVILLFTALCACNIFDNLIISLIGIRCLIPNNYFVWEATRPISDCGFCLNVTAPIILHNASREEFAPYAYTSKPIIIRKAFLHWPAYELFNFYFFKELYESIDDSIQSVDEECQFLHFKSNFISLKDVFDMTKDRINNKPGQNSWYVGWGNCHSQVLKEMRKHYPKPHFLPDDCEIPSKEYVFMGYDAGATMHLDFINRLMWQAQLKGSKTWNLLPSNECEQFCSPVTFKVYPGDAVLVDTRVWYHGTTITPGEFSLSIQSEYG
ncbi:PREDICTED: uncharacterized protein LOC108565394 [Nicrophorus vespilloides]|uniref:Uncharacterized protein LOC108565394 n=1 Tax=Nicrophorus vespilloides TaxID=110193 RepID=A0ABM1N0G0_NICVS|nr:PREDICTED: uncharacterized protein LOC108565394 [Nicrophorus vespilloides]